MSKSNLIQALPFRLRKLKGVVRRYNDPRLLASCNMAHICRKCAWQYLRDRIRFEDIGNAIDDETGESSKLCPECEDQRRVRNLQWRVRDNETRRFHRVLEADARECYLSGQSDLLVEDSCFPLEKPCDPDEEKLVAEAREELVAQARQHQLKGINQGWEAKVLRLEAKRIHSEHTSAGTRAASERIQIGMKRAQAEGKHIGRPRKHPH